MWSPDGRYLAYRRYTDCGGPRTAAAGRRDQRRGGQRARHVPARGMGHRVVAGFHARRGVGRRRSRRSASTGSTALGRRSSRCRPDGPGSGDHDPVWMPDGTSLMGSQRGTLPLDGSAPRQLPFAGRPYATYSPDGSHVAYSDRPIADGRAVRRLRTPGGVRGLGPGTPHGLRPAIGSRSRRRARQSVVHELRVARCGDRLGDTADRRGARNVPLGDRVLTAGRPHPLLEGRGPRSGERSLWSIGVDGSDARLVVAGTSAGSGWGGDHAAVPRSIQPVASPRSDQDRAVWSVGSDR